MKRVPHLTHWIDSVVSALLLRMAQPAEQPRPDRAELAYYDRPALLNEPGRLYDFPDVLPELQRVPGEPFPWCAEHQIVSFPSPYSPLPSGYERRYAAYGENHRAIGHLYRPAGPSRGAILYLHGWMAASMGLEERFLFPAVVGRAGLTVLSLTLPFHGARRPASSAFSGEYFASADLPRTLESFRQAVAEARALLAWLRRETHGPVGLGGLSLGALVGALFLGGGAQPDFAVLALTPADVVGTVEKAPLLRWLQQDLQAAAVEREELARWARLVRPMALTPAISPRRILLIHGRHDAIALPEGVAALWEAWDHPSITWYNGGHFSIILHPRRVLRWSREFLEQQGVLAGRRAGRQRQPVS